MTVSPHSSGDLLADRRYRYAEASLAEADYVAAADLARQTLELAPGFAAAWFLLGRALAEQMVHASEAEAALLRDDAVAAFQAALRRDPDDGQGARLRLAELGVGDPCAAVSHAYIRALFDDYAPRFDRHLVRGLAYRGPALLHDAVRRACSLRLRRFRFGRALDLGCGTGLAARAFAAECGMLAGIDLSPAMVAKAHATQLYDTLDIGDLVAWLEGQETDSADLILAADVFVYMADLSPVFAQAARVMARDALFAFTVQAHEGEGVVLGADARYAHAEPHLRGLAAKHGLAPVVFERVSTRQDRGRDVPGFLAVLAWS